MPRPTCPKFSRWARNQQDHSVPPSLFGQMGPILSGGPAASAGDQVDRSPRRIPREAGFRGILLALLRDGRTDRTKTSVPSLRTTDRRLCVTASISFGAARMRSNSSGFRIDKAQVRNARRASGLSHGRLPHAFTASPAWGRSGDEAGLVAMAPIQPGTWSRGVRRQA